MGNIVMGKSRILLLLWRERVDSFNIMAGKTVYFNIVAGKTICFIFVAGKTVYYIIFAGKTMYFHYYV